MNPTVEMWTGHDTLHISVKNLPELYALIAQATEEIKQLCDTMRKLSCFDLDVQFSASCSNSVQRIQAEGGGEGKEYESESTVSGVQ